MRKDTEATTESQVMTGAEMIMTALAEHGVRHVFGYPGGAVLPLYDALAKQSRVYHTLVSHEQGAVHAAEGYARSTGKIGCVFVTSGPGATNTVTGLMDAYADSVPLIVVSGQVSSSLIGTDAFQECDIVGITRPCTKHSEQVTAIADLPRILHKALSLAQSGRPGPVLIDIPKDIQNAQGLYRPAPAAFVASDKPDDAFAEAIEQAVALMRTAERPVFYTGGGVTNAGERASELLRELVQATGFPITSTLMGLGAYPASGESWLGMLGMHGAYEANKAMHGADLIVAVGARFDDRVTGRVDGFAPQAKKIHIDIDPRSINKIVRVNCGIVADCETALAAIGSSWRKQGGSASTQNLKPWWERIEAWRREKSFGFVNSDTVIKPQYALQRLGHFIRARDSYVVTDVGQHQMWTAQHIGFEQPRRLMTSGGLGTMGYGLPAALGVQTAHPDSLVVCVSGDGSFQMNSQEMATARQENLPVKVVLINNNALGMVRQWQGLYHENRFSASKGKGQPDFVKLAEAYGWAGFRCTSPHTLDAAFQALIETPEPCLLDCVVEANEDCFPMIPVGFGHDTMTLGARL